MKTVKIRFDSIERIENKHHGMECTLNNPVIEDISELAIESLLGYIDEEKLFKEIAANNEDVVNRFLNSLDKESLKYYGLNRSVL